MDSSTCWFCASLDRPKLYLWSGSLLITQVLPLFILEYSRFFINHFSEQVENWIQLGSSFNYGTDLRGWKTRARLRRWRCVTPRCLARGHRSGCIAVVGPGLSNTSRPKWVNSVCSRSTDATLLVSFALGATPQHLWMKATSDASNV